MRHTHRMMVTSWTHQPTVTMYRLQFWRTMPAAIMPSSGGNPLTAAAARPAAAPTVHSSNTDATLPPGMAIRSGVTFTSSRHQATTTSSRTAVASATAAGHCSSHRSNSFRQHPFCFPAVSSRLSSARHELTTSPPGKAISPAKPERRLVAAFVAARVSDVFDGRREIRSIKNVFLLSKRMTIHLYFHIKWKCTIYLTCNTMCKHM